jgi:hypothetical protein
LVCDKNGEWSVAADNPCIAIEQSANSAVEDFLKFQQMYCPRPATAEQTERTFETAPMFRYWPHCRRYADVSLP